MIIFRARIAALIVFGMLPVLTGVPGALLVLAAVLAACGILTVLVVRRASKHGVGLAWTVTA